MMWLVRTFAAIVISTAVAHGVAQACTGNLSCSKTASVSEITEYPTTVIYTVTFAYDLPGDRCAVGALSDSLLPADFFSFPTDWAKDPNLFWVSNPPVGNQEITYEFTIESFEHCASLGSAPEADGSVKLTNYVNGSSYFAEFFNCQKAIVCRPPPDGEGCTLTPGYWKTHSNFGPASYDATWANIVPSGANSPFFSSGQTYFEVLWSDTTGDAYYILARAYIAAVLNGYNGASTTDAVDAALSFAAGFFNANSPGAVLTKDQRGQVIAFAAVLDDYNNGIVGPGHCAE